MTRTRSDIPYSNVVENRCWDFRLTYSTQPHCWCAKPLIRSEWSPVVKHPRASNRWVYPMSPSSSYRGHSWYFRSIFAGITINDPPMAPRINRKRKTQQNRLGNQLPPVRSPPKRSWNKDGKGAAKNNTSILNGTHTDSRCWTKWKTIQLIFCKYISFTATVFMEFLWILFIL